MNNWRLIKKRKLKKNTKYPLFTFLSSYCYPQKVGGVELYVFQRAKELSERRIRTRIICANKNGFKYKKIYINDFLTIEFLPVINSSKILFFITFLFSFLFFYSDKKSKSDIILDCQFLGVPSIIGYIASLFYKSKLIITCHGSDILILRKNSYIKKIQDIVLKKACRILTISPKIENILKQERCFKDKIFLTNLGINISENLNFSVFNKTPRFLFIGRLDKNKNPLTTIKIVKQLILSNFKVELTIWGDGKLKNEVLIALKDFPTTGKADYRSRVSHNDVISKIKEYDCFIMTSLSEGTPLSLLEAMSFGLICFIPPEGGIKNIIIDGYNGVFIDINKINESANKIIRVLNDNEKRMKIRKNAINTIKDFYSPDLLLKRYIDIVLTNN